jgi:hypothetical protein
MTAARVVPTEVTLQPFDHEVAWKCVVAVANNGSHRIAYHGQRLANDVKITEIARLLEIGAIRAV